LDYTQVNNILYVWGCIQKFLDWVYAYVWYYLLRSSTKLTRLTHKIGMQLHLVAERCTIFSSRTSLPTWKLGYTLVCAGVLILVRIS
jgi:hypothetical protein